MYIWVSLLGKIFHGNETPYKYLAESNENFPSPKQLLKLFEEKGFKKGKIHNYFLGQVSAQIVTK
jgi:ubiquinone/menaquinone biosynthesis C-methylase UbiE